MAAARRFGVPRVLQRRDKIFLAFALEFFLRGPEVCNAHCDFLAFPRQSILLFGHAHPFLSRVPSPLASAIGARIGTRRCKIVMRALAVDKIAALLVGGAPSR